MTIDIVHATVWQIATIATAGGLVTALTQPKLGSIADKIGRKPVLIVGRASFFLFPLLCARARKQKILIRREQLRCVGEAQ